ncbi:ABC-F family ATP-binding cassette domain-containing protein [Propionibacteriaceae bacterium Y2011]
MSHPNPVSHPAVVLSGLSYAWPDGDVALDAIDATFGAGRTGLVGANGTGKTTLLRLLAGELTPTAGSVTTTGAVGLLPQHLTLRTADTVADLLGVRERLDAIRSIETGRTDQALLDVVGHDWEIESRSLAALTRAGLPDIGLDRTIDQLSGGEAVLVALVGRRLAATPIVLLDEPTNNLDRTSRHRLYDMITRWRGALVVVSHDVALLDLMDDTAELRAGSLTVFGGAWTAWTEHVAAEQAAAEQALRTARQALRTERRQRVEAETKLARRSRYARTDYENKRRPKTIMKQRASEAQVSAGKLRGELDEKVDAARDLVDRQADRIRRDDHIRVDLPDPKVPANRRLAELRDGSGTVVTVQGPERVALTGRNGIGKTRLLDGLVGLGGPPTATGVHAIAHTDRIGHLPQRLDHLPDDVSILDAVRQAAPDSLPGDLRNRLARFGFRTGAVHRPVAELSGGERFRVALAQLLLADPPAQLLVLDEPTNNLDLPTVDVLVDALTGHRGGLIIVSHDDAFLDRLGLHVRLLLDEAGLHHDQQ